MNPGTLPGTTSLAVAVRCALSRWRKADRSSSSGASQRELLNDSQSGNIR